MTILEHLREARQPLPERYVCSKCSRPLEQRLVLVGRSSAWLWTCPADDTEFSHFNRKRVTEGEYRHAVALFGTEAQVAA